MVRPREEDRIHLDPSEVAEDLRRFGEAARRLSTEHPHLLERYAGQWVSLYDGEVRATGSSLRAVLAELDLRAIPREHVVVRFLERDRRPLIL